MSSCVKKLAVRSGVEVVRIGGRKQLADERQRSCLAAARLGAAGRVAADDERAAARREVAGVGRVRVDGPAAGQAHAVRVHEPAEALALGAPAQIDGRVERARAVGAELFREAERRQAADHGSQRHLVHRERRLAGGAPDALIGIGVEGFDDVGESRADVGAAVVGGLRETRRCWSRRDYTPLVGGHQSSAGGRSLSAGCSCTAACCQGSEKIVESGRVRPGSRGDVKTSPAASASSDARE